MKFRNKDGVGMCVGRNPEEKQQLEEQASPSPKYHTAVRSGPPPWALAWAALCHMVMTSIGATATLQISI